MAFDITPYIDKTPAEVRAAIRAGEIDFPTAGMCRGYAQANLIILPPEYAADFEEYAKLNPFPCPILEVIKGADTLKIKRVVGPRSKVKGSDMDLYHLLEQNAQATHKPRLYISCGTGDFLYPVHKQFCPAAKKAGWDVTQYEKPDAVHEWGFWDEQIKAFIPWALTSQDEA